MATPPHRKVESKTSRVQFNMDTKICTSKHIPDERCIATQPWYIALKRAQSGQPTRIGNSAYVHVCPVKAKFNLENIDPAGRSPVEAEAWNKVIGQAGTQAQLPKRRSKKN